MTLIITSLSDDTIVQVSDRRVTRNGVLVDDECNKAVFVVCKDARFSIAYTGLAEIFGNRTDEWIFNYLTSINAGCLSFPDILKSLHSKLASKAAHLLRLGPYRKLSFVFAGFGPPGPFLATLSNFEGESGKLLDKIDDSFRFWIIYRNKDPMQKLAFLIHGSERAIKKNIEILINKVRNRYFDADPKKIATVLVQLIREAAKDKDVGHYIGRSCMGLMLKVTGDNLWEYYPDETISPVIYGPHMILRCQSFSDVMISSEKPDSW